MLSMRLTSILSAIRARASARFGPLARARDANVTLITAVALVPTMFGLGFCIDYARAEMLQSRISAVADAAALAGTDPEYLLQQNSVAQADATTIFTKEVATYADFTQTSLTVTVTSTSTFGRTVDVSWSGTSKNMFSGILGSAALAIGGDSTAAASLPPSINFYVALDTSPSMLLPTTTTGIANLKAGAIWTGEQTLFGQTNGCDFACHSTNMQQWNDGVYVIDTSGYMIFTTTSGTIPFYRVSCSGAVYNNTGTQIGASGTIQTSTGGSTSTYCSGGSNPQANPVVLKYKATGATSYTTVNVNYPDTWWLAENYNTVNPGGGSIQLRTDAEQQAAASLIQTAYTNQQNLYNASSPGTSPIYKLQFYTFNYNGSGFPSPVALSTSSPFNAMTAVSTLQSATFPALGANAPLLAGSGYWTSTSASTGNADTNHTAMLTGMQSIIPNTAGTGTQASPQQVLMIITDGVEDDSSDGITALTTNNNAQCTAIKKYARIAILYTQYTPATINYTAHPTFNSTASNVLPNVAAQLQACSSQNTDGSYLFMTVTTDGDISGALSELFAAVVQTAHLTR
jgi:hypothetical protein